MSAPKPIYYPHLSTFDRPPKCQFCGMSWTEVVHLLEKYKTWERMPDCPARVDAAIERQR